MTPSFRGVAARNIAEKKMVCANFCEISRSFLRESSLLRIFIRGVNAKKEFFTWADCIYAKFDSRRINDMSLNVLFDNIYLFDSFYIL